MSTLISTPIYNSRVLKLPSTCSILQNGSFHTQYRHKPIKLCANSNELIDTKTAEHSELELQQSMVEEEEEEDQETRKASKIAIGPNVDKDLKKVGSWLFFTFFKLFFFCLAKEILYLIPLCFDYWAEEIKDLDSDLWKEKKRRRRNIELELLIFHFPPLNFNSNTA